MSVHCLGPNPTCPATRMAQARGLMSGKTNRGIYFPLTRARTVKAQAQKQDCSTKVRPRYKRSRSSKDQHADQEDQDQAREVRNHQEKSLPCRAGEPGKDGVTPGRKPPRRPGRACRDPRRRSHLTEPLHHDARHRSMRCRAAK